MRPNVRSGIQLLGSFLRLAAVALAPFVLATACRASAPLSARAVRPARSALPRLSWHPRSGATEIDCSPPIYECDKIGLEKCEAECADGDLPDCVAFALWQEHTLGKGGDRARGLAVLRVACEKGFGQGCVALAAHPGATARDRATITTTLAPACARGDLCACSLHGSALTLDPQEGARGIELLSDSCARGASDACDTLSLLRDLCDRDRTPRAIVRGSALICARRGRPRSGPRPSCRRRWRAAFASPRRSRRRTASAARPKPPPRSTAGRPSKATFARRTARSIQARSIASCQVGIS